MISSSRLIFSPADWLLWEVRCLFIKNRTNILFKPMTFISNRTQKLHKALGLGDGLKLVVGIDYFSKSRLISL